MITVTKPSLCKTTTKNATEIQKCNLMKSKIQDCMLIK